MMEIFTATDILLLQAGALGASAYAVNSFRSKIFQPRHATQPDLPLLTAAKVAKPTAAQPVRSILKQLEQTGRSCMVFYGSQTGTAERFAHRFSREALAKYNLSCLVGDLDDYDFGDLVKLSVKHLIVFILSTYGEGEPTDNAIPFQKYLEGHLNSHRLSSLRYSAFGLGSTSYTQFNAMIRRVDNILTSHDALRIGEVGLGDDGKGTLEEDFVQWTGNTLASIATAYNLSQVEYRYKPSFEVSETAQGSSSDRRLFLGEPNKAHLFNKVRGPFTAQNPFPATVVEAKNMFPGTDRSCLHLDFDISGTNLQYDTGDHLAIWPVNSDREVDLFLDVFGLTAKKSCVVDVKSNDPNTKVPIPARTTYETTIRYYLDICTVVTREVVRQLSNFAVSDATRTKLLRLANDKDMFTRLVTHKQLTIGQLLCQYKVTEDYLYPETIVAAPFSLILEIIPKLRQRHYSISSSSLVSSKKISITAVIDSKQNEADGIDFNGVSTSYLQAINTMHQAVSGSTPEIATHTLSSPRQPKSGPLKALIHVRTSKFRPPFQPSTPIIMVGPGTGVAPFRAFVAERALQHSQGRTVGRTLLFYGCHRPDEDFLYRDEWDDIIENEKLGRGVFTMHTAFSRQPGQKRTYVQDLVNEQQEELRDLITNQNARVYICGNAARMAKDVGRAFAKVLSSSNKFDEGFAQIEQLKKAGRWSEDVW